MDMMRSIIFFLISTVVLLNPLTGNAQDNTGFLEGKVTFITSQNVYVKFTSAKGISAGDTLYVNLNGKVEAVLVVNNLSSVSCVCSLLPESRYQPAVSDILIFKGSGIKDVINPGNPVQGINEYKPVKKVDTLDLRFENNKDVLKKLPPSFFGSMSASVNGTFSGDHDYSGTRLKYGLNFKGRNLASGKLNFDSYFLLIYKQGNWDQSKNNMFNYLKLYSLSVDYAVTKNSTLWFGRRVNPRMGSMGAVDGLQYEIKAGKFTAGVLAGSRPDYRDYGIDINLLQYGVYLSHDAKFKNGYFQSTVSYVDQQNSGKTDRRFLYFQHSNNVVRNLSFFGSVEIDLYNLSINLSDTTYTNTKSPQFSNLNTSFRYRFSRQLSASLSFTSRKTVIYYETYKSFLDRIIDSDHLQGYSAQINYNPVRRISIGVNGAYRFQKNDPHPTSNLYTYLTFNLLPNLGWTTTLSTTLLKTAYLNGRIYSLGLNGDVIKGKLSGGINFRYVNYKYSELVSEQQIGELNLMWRIYKKLSLSGYYESCFTSPDRYNRVYLQMRLGF